MANESSLASLHYQLINGLLLNSKCPTNADLARTLDISETGVQELLQDLAAIHGVVLHPHVCEPWILHPFSLTPTLNWVKAGTGSWWAPCIWCALGVGALAGGQIEIHTRYGAEGEPLVIDVVNGVPARQDIWVHFAIPPARAWDNVHQHCSLVLPFHSPTEIDNWCGRYGKAMGEAVSIQNVARLARTWYGSHASPAWRKWSVSEAQEIFSSAGLTSGFWNLGPSRSGEF